MVHASTTALDLPNRSRRNRPSHCIRCPRLRQGPALARSHRNDPRRGRG
nr:MAG TPA: hypothetical protein [Caudoviricetes sp.]